MTVVIEIDKNCQRKVFESRKKCKKQSNKLEYKTVECIKKDKEIPFPVEIDKFSHFPKENIIKNTKTKRDSKLY